MSKLVCNMCGAPITEKICKYCKNEIEDDKYEEYKKMTSYLEDYNNVIKKKTIIGEKLTEQEDLKFRALLKNRFIPNENFYDVNILFHFLNQNKIFSYDTFEQYVMAFTEKTIQDFAKSINPKWNTSHVSASIRKLKPGWKGCAIAHYFYSFDQDEIKRFYEGSLGSFTTILHEIYHGGHDLMITNKMVNAMLMQIIKEDIIREDDIRKNGEDNYYYTNNYKSISSEIFAQQMAVSFLEYFLKTMNMRAPANYIEFERNRTDHDISNQNRKIIVDGEEKIMTVDEIFDNVIVNYPEKLNTFPQLNLEYVVENNKVRKKTKAELNETLDALEDSNAIEYLQTVINKKGLN